MKPIHCSDHLELAVIDLLIANQIRFIHESQNNDSRLDFYLPDYDVYLEVKQYHTDRVNGQLASQENVILIQGKKSLAMLVKLLTPCFK